MYGYEQCKRYQAAVSQKDLEAVLSLFAPDGIVEDSQWGTLDAREFHMRLFHERTPAITRLTKVFDGIGKTRSIALQFSCIWISDGGRVLTRDGITVFEIDAQIQKFRKIQIIYDPTAVRSCREEVSVQG